MNEQRKQILEMVAVNKLTVEEAERLIDALGDTTPQNLAAPEPKPKRPKFLRVLVDAREDDEQAHVNIRIPILLLRAGVKLASLVPPQALDQANDQLQRSGMTIDLTKLKPEDIDELVDHLGEMTVEVESADAKVHVFCE
jgi:hypothetical protein